jgi:phospholipase/carboxylesterase
MQGTSSVKRNKTDKSILLMPSKPFFSLIWLHGLGDSSEGFLGFFQAKQSPVSHGGRIKLLNAPIRKVTINGGMQSTSWYDIYNLAPNGKNEERFNLEEVKDSLRIIESHVVGEIAYWRENGITGTDE